LVESPRVQNSHERGVVVVGRQGMRHKKRVTAGIASRGDSASEYANKEFACQNEFMMFAKMINPFVYNCFWLSNRRIF
jgi:hypothetical protein